MFLQNLQTELAELIFNEELNSDSIFPNQHMIIYRNNIMSNLKKTLIEIYPFTMRIVGKDFFHSCAMEYIKRYPSRSSNMHDFGEYFSDFLAEYFPAKHLIYLPEVAEFEWINHLLYFAPDHTEFDLTLLKNISSNQYEQLYFTLHPASRLKKFHYPILRIVDLCNNEIDTSVNINEGGVLLLMFRRDLKITLTSLLPADFAFLNALSQNKSLSQCLQAALDIDQDFNLVDKLPFWIKDKIIVDCHFNET